MILAIDPGNKESGYAIVSNDYIPIKFGKEENNTILDIISLCDRYEIDHAVIEMVASYGMPVGETVFDTCVWIGRFVQMCEDWEMPVSFVKRKEYVTDLCGSAKAKDANVIQYLIDRFAKDTPNRGKGTKKAPGFFYGFHADCWQAQAIAVWYIDKERSCSQKNKER